MYPPNFGRVRGSSIGSFVCFVLLAADSLAEAIGPKFQFTDIALTPSSAVMNVSVASGDYVHHPTNRFDLFDKVVGDTKGK